MWLHLDKSYILFSKSHNCDLYISASYIRFYTQYLTITIFYIYLKITRTSKLSVLCLFLDSPGSPTIEGFPIQSSISGKTETVSCTARGGNPSPSMAWYKGGNLYNTGVQTSTDMDGMLYLIKYTFVSEY